MKEWFICPDKEVIELNACINGCRMDMRCMSVPSLLGVSNDRPWSDRVSPSMAGIGNRAIYLDKVTPYAFNPRESVFMLYGTKHHAVKEDAAKELNAFLEEVVEDELGSGICDYFDGSIYDYKFVGSYSLGKRAHFAVVPSGELYKRTGKWGKEGDPKMKKVLKGFKIEPDDPWALQINAYRLKWETSGFPVEDMFVEVTLRDGGLAAANRGFDRKVYVLRIPKIPDEQIRKYYSAKLEVLRRAFGDPYVCPPICTDEERWHDGIPKKCFSYCDVWDTCIRHGGWTKKDIRKVLIHKKGEYRHA